jgi:hypothetical protein
MPDECCRKCGNQLRNYLKCTNCHILFQEICLKCGEKTLPKFHRCMNASIAS